MSDNLAGSLRQAITLAKSNPGPDVITFNLPPGPGQPPYTISLQSALPIITDTLVIDGTTQPGFTGLPIIELNGILTGANGRGLDIRADGCTVRGLVINQFSGGGIRLQNNGGNLIEHNLVGTDTTGTVGLGNGTGIGNIVIANSSNNVIGGVAANSRNVISGNGFAGVQINGVGSISNRVQGNFIGTDLTGTVPLSNQGDGVLIRAGASQNLVGGTSGSARNVISGNANGVAIFGPAPQNLVQGNFIGTDVTGNNSLGNVLAILVSASVSNSTIGGFTAGAGNVIAFNSGGITLDQAAGPGNLISGNSIFANGFGPIGASLGIDLGGDLITFNDPGDTDAGPNNLQNFPDLSEATMSSNATMIKGVLLSHPVTTYRLEFFNSPQCNPTGFGEGRIYLGARTVTTDASGSTTFSFIFATPLPLDSVITATATDTANNTSEFSSCVLVHAALSDLSVSVAVAPPYPHVGENFTYIATVTSSGDDVQTSVVLSNQLPAGINFVSVMPSQGACTVSNGLVVCQLGDVPPGLNPTVAITVNSTNENNLVNVTSVSSTAPDVDPANNTVVTTTRVYVPGPPVIEQQPQGGIVPAGGTIVLQVSGSPPPLLFQWRRNGVNLPGETNDTLVLNNVGPMDGAGYTVVVANEFDAVTSQSAPVTVDTPPLPLADDFNNATFITDPNGLASGNNFNSTNQPGEPLHLGKPGGKSVWINWEALESGLVTFSTAGSTFDTILAAYTGQTIDALTEVAADEDSGNFLNSTISFNAVAGTVYHIVVDGFSGQEGFITLGWQLESNAPRQPEILEHPLSQAVDLNQPAQLKVLVANQAGTTFQYQWYLNGQRITGADQDTLLVPNVNAQTVGGYFARVTGNNRSVDSRSAFLQVNQNAGGPDPVLATGKFRDTTDAAGGATGRSRGSKSIPKVVAHGFSGTQIFSTLGSTTEPGEPNHCGVIGGASYWFAYQPPTNGLVFISTEGSSYDTVLAIYTGPGDEYSTLVPVACDNNSGADGLDSKTTFTGVGGTIYWIAVDGVGGVSGTVVLNWNLVQAPKITLQPVSQTTTNGSNATFTVTASGTAPLAYQWRFNGANLLNRTNASLTISNAAPVNEGGYTVVITNAAGSITSVVATLTVLVPPSISSQPSSLTVTNGSNAIFSVTAAGTAPLTYQWRFNGGNLVNQTNTALTISNATPANEGGYTVVITNTAGSITSSVATLTVLVPPSITSQPSSLTVTNGSNAIFSVTAAGTAPLAYQWRFNGGNLSNQTNTSLTISNAAPGNEGSYTVVITNTVGSITSTIATLTVLVPPAITVQPASQIVTNGRNVTFSVSATGTPTPGYQWRFNNSNIPGATSTSLVLTNVQHTNSGNYVVVVNNSAGAVTSAVAVLTVLLPLELRAPTSSLSGFRFTVVCSSNVDFKIETSTNLINWTPLLTTNSATGLYNFIETNATNFPHRFYRAAHDLP